MNHFSIDRNEIMKKIEQELTKNRDINLDFTQHSYLTLWRDLVSIADENLLFYISFLINESYISTAILPETINKFAMFCGINPNYCVPASSTVKMKFKIRSYDKSWTIVIPKYTQLVSDNHVFSLMETIEIKYIASTDSFSILRIEEDSGQKIYGVVDNSIEIDESNEKWLTFFTTVKQIEIRTMEIQTNNPLQNIELDIKDGEFIYDVKCFVNDNEIKSYPFIHMIPQWSLEYGYTIVGNKIFFGNDYFGMPIPKNNIVRVEVQVTNGFNGNTPSNTLKFKDKLITSSGEMFSIEIEHNDITNGQNPKSPLELKTLIHDKILSRDTLISKKRDVEKINYYLDYVVKYAKGVLYPPPLSDFTVFVSLNYGDSILKTTTATVYDVIEANSAIQTIGFDMNNKAVICDKDKHEKYVSLPKRVIDYFFNKNDNEFLASINKDSESAGFKVPFVSKYLDALNIVSFSSFLSNTELETRKIFSKPYSYDDSSILELDKITVNYIYNSIKGKEYIVVKGLVKFNLLNIEDLENQVNVSICLLKNDKEVYKLESIYGDLLLDYDISKNRLRFESNTLSETIRGVIPISYYDDEGNIVFDLKDDSEYKLKITLQYRYYEELGLDFETISINESLPINLFYETGSYSKIGKIEDNSVYESNIYKLEKDEFRRIDTNTLTDEGEPLFAVSSDSSEYKFPKLVLIKLEPNKYMLLIDKSDQNGSSLDKLVIKKIGLIKNDSENSIQYDILYDKPIYVKNTYEVIAFECPSINDPEKIILINSDSDGNEICMKVKQTKVLDCNISKIYQVPLIHSEEYANNGLYNPVSLAYDTFKLVNEKLREKIFFGCNYNIKFIKTAGKLSNMKYNKKHLTYDESIIGLFSTPLKIKLKILTDGTFTKDDELLLKDKILNFINSRSNPSEPEKSVKYADLVSLVNSIDKVKSVISIQPDKDIIYTYDIYNDIYFNTSCKIDTYVPELVYTTDDCIEIETYDDYKIGE